MACRIGTLQDHLAKDMPTGPDPLASQLSSREQIKQRIPGDCGKSPVFPVKLAAREASRGEHLAQVDRIVLPSRITFDGDGAWSYAEFFLTETERIMKIALSLCELTPRSLRKVLEDLKQPGYRADQILKGFHVRRQRTYAGMTDLPAALRERLAGELQLLTTSVARKSVSTDGTVKLLIKMADGELVECVMIPDGKRRTACLSTQVGCPVGCVFCASGVGGVKRNLTAGEIVEQALHLTDVLPAEERLTHVVVMGMGEPFLNYERLLGAIETLHAPWGFGIGVNRITVSTVGLADKIAAFGEHPLATNLAVSLHAPTDELRLELIPHAPKTEIDTLVQTALNYRRRTGKDVTFEYVLLAGRNDQSRHARALARRLKGSAIKVNLIPLNPIDFAPLSAPTRAQVQAFQGILEQEGVTCTTRRRRGSDVDAACGQLRLTKITERHAAGTENTERAV